MKVDLFNNSGLKNFKDELEDQMLNANSFDIATAFITNEAIELINIFLNENKTIHRIGRLITGFYHSFNSQEVLIKLQELARSSNGRLLVNMSKNERFHWKYYNFKCYNEEVSFIGSSNFTGAGMTQKGELVLKISLNNKDKSEKENLKDLFNKEFANSVDIAKVPLEDYEQSKSAKTNSNGLPLSIRNILKSGREIKPIRKEVTSILAVFLSGDFSAKTKKIIKEKKSNWDECHFACYGKSDYEASIKSGLIFIIQCYSRKYSFSICEVVDNCQLRTPDGNYFIAYKVVKKINRETKKLRNELEELGLNYHSRNFKWKSLRNRQTKELFSLFSYGK